MCILLTRSGRQRLPARGVTGLSIDLASVSYNYDSATGSCAKHQVNLVYEANASSPLSLAMLGNKPLVRMHKLHAVDVKAREVAANSTAALLGPDAVAAHL